MKHLMKRLISSIVLSLGLATVTSSYAQWKFSIDTGLRYVHATEIGTDGQELVRERGWLPGAGFTSQYAAGNWQVGLVAELYRNDVTYDGQLQSGAAFKSETDTSQRRIRLEAGRQLTEAMQLTAAIEQDVWQRNIQGRGGIAGMREKYASWRILAGAKSRITRWAPGAIDVKGAIVFARPERLTVRFDGQLFDDVSFRTKSATGFRLGLGYQPVTIKNFSFEADFDWIKIARSDDAVLRRNGIPVGFVAQSKHERAAFGMRAIYRF